MNPQPSEPILQNAPEPGPALQYDAHAHAKAVATICTDYAEGNTTLAACCKNAGIALEDFRAWLAESDAVAALWDAANQAAHAHFVEEALLAARAGLLRLLAPTHTEEQLTIETTTDKEGRPQGEKRKLSRAPAMPHPATVAFALGALLPGQFGKKQATPGGAHPQPDAENPTADPFAHIPVAELSKALGLCL